ncbi:MAG: P-II family nitrogen regulator [Selenomonas sp.]|nr:P-II family nitrogen regulator [Selenomonas sp.]
MHKLYKIEIITRPEKLDALKNALYAIRVTGMTVSQVYGCGLSQGHTEFYRGQKVSTELLPKIKVEIVVYDIPVETIVETAQQVCHTGHIGDGKIFVYAIDNAIRIRTNESGPDAIIDRLEDRKIVNAKARQAIENEPHDY